MPIGNAYLSQWHIAEAAFPVGMIGNYDSYSYLSGEYELTEGTLAFSDDPPSHSTMDLAYGNFSSRVESSISPSEMMQGFPLAKTHDVGVVTHIYDITMPIILVPATSGGSSYRIRLNEVVFWLSWVTYMFSTFDRIGDDTQSTIVENASIEVGDNGVQMSLRIRTNWVMPWKLKLSEETVVGRRAKNYDTFVKFDERDGGSIDDFSGMGFEDAWGVAKFSSRLTTSFETIVMARRTSTVERNFVPDQLNAKMVSMNGQLESFGYINGKDWEDTAVSIQTTDDFSAGIDASVSKYDDVINGTLEAGGIQLYVGSYDNGSAQGRPLLMLPTGMLINASEMRAGSGLITVFKEFSGIFSDIPKMSSKPPTAKLEVA